MAVSRMQASTMLGVFTFAGVVTLPNRYLIALVAVVYAVVWPTFKRAGAKAHRHAYTGLSVAAACVGASAVYHRLGLEPVAVAASIATFTAINLAMVALAIAAAGHRQSWPMLRNPHLYRVLVASMLLGTAVGHFNAWHPLAGAVGMPVIFAVHLRAARATVEETGACVGGVWNRTGWLAFAEEAHRLGDRFAFIFVDLTGVHDANVAAEVVRARLGSEVIGRYSETQLVVLLRECDDTTVHYLSRRLGRALRLAALDAGVGCVTSCDATTVAGMLTTAVADAVISRAADAATDLR